MCWLAQAACSLFTLNPSPAYLPFLWSPLTGATDLNENLICSSNRSAKTDCQVFTMSGPFYWFTKLPFSRFGREGKWKWLDRIISKNYFEITKILTRQISNACQVFTNSLIMPPPFSWFTKLPLHQRGFYKWVPCHKFSACQWVRNTQTM